MILQIYFILLLIFFFKSKSIPGFLILLQIISLSGIYFTGNSYQVKSFFDIFNLVFTIILLTIIISPWRMYKNVYVIDSINEIKLKRLTYILLIISAFTFIILSATAIFVFLSVDDINTFKYAERISTDFYYRMPVGVKALILASYLYNFSYFLIPLHFYYLTKGKRRLSTLCFIFSLNIFVFGLTYFSRVALVNWVLVYLSFLILLYNTLNTKQKRNTKKTIVVLGSLFLLYFIYITNSRFTDNTQYLELIPRDSKIQDPILFSYIDYLSQSYNNGMYVLSNYDFRTFNGQLSLLPVLKLLGHYNIINFSTANYLALRRQLWPLHYYTFNGYVAYVVYDFGFFLALIISVIYYYVIKKLRPKNHRISLTNLFLLVLLIQLPVFAIFYSAIGGLVVPFLLLVPILFYLKTTTNKGHTLNYKSLN